MICGYNDFFYDAIFRVADHYLDQPVSTFWFLFFQKNGSSGL
jgi:hypothetical protein